MPRYLLIKFRGKKIKELETGVKAMTVSIDSITAGLEHLLYEEECDDWLIIGYDTGGYGSVSIKMRKDHDKALKRKSLR